MPELISVRPSRQRLVGFARWAVAQRPKVRTAGVGVFGVPVDLFPTVPEPLLVGATVDGQPYVPVGAPDELVELVDVDQPPFLPEQTAQAGREGPLPPLPESAYPADATLLPEPEPEPLPEPEPAGDGEHRCPRCPRGFASPRGLTAHIRQAHSEG